MKKTKIIFLPLLFLIVLSFFSCDTNDSVPPTFNTSEIYGGKIQLVKAKGYHIDKKSGLPYLELEYDVYECNVIDTLYVRCKLLLSHWPTDYSKNVIAIVKAHKAISAKVIYLSQDATGVGSIQSQNPLFVSFIGRIFLSDATTKKGLKVASYGDEVTVEIESIDMIPREFITVKPK